MPEVKYHEITPQGIVITTKDGEKKTVEAGTIVLAAGALPERKLYEEIKDKVPEVYCVGDCVEPRTIRDAIGDGYRTGLQI